MNYLSHNLQEQFQKKNQKKTDDAEKKSMAAKADMDMKSKRESTKNHPIEKVGKELRSKMKFLNSEKLVDKEKNQ